MAAPAKQGKVGTEGRVLTVALRYLRTGLSVIPIRRDGSKAPAVKTWKEYQTHLASDAEVRGWFGVADPPGIGVLGGAVSGGLECIDFDVQADELYPRWCDLVEAECPGLIARLCVVRTPRPGFHVRFRCNKMTIPGNTKLAVDPTLPADERTLIETRGEGGYALVPGSPAACHATGRPYEFAGDVSLAETPTISAAERETLLRSARSFNREPQEDAARHGADVRLNGALRPGDDYNQRGPDWAEILVGWSEARRLADGVRYWRRPGKEGPGWSATTGACRNKDGADLFACFSENAAPFQGAQRGKPCSCYTKFSAYTLLNHGGDFGAAAKELRRQGYGGGEKSDHSTKGRAHPPAPEPPPWPDPPEEEAFHGLAGRIVRAIGPASEADPAALLVQALVAFGSAAGRSAHFVVEDDWHHANEFAVLVGCTSKARKGTSWGRIRRLFTEADEQWAADRVQSGLSSGEGLVWAVRDPICKRERVRDRGQSVRYEQVEADPGVQDKRLLVYEPEFANVLKQTERQGNTLSAILRQAWDGGDLRTLTKNSPARATGAYVSLIGHITADELRRYLTQTETANGYGNRHLWVCAERSKQLPEGGRVDPAEWGALRNDLAGALAFARTIRQIRRDDEARGIWCEVYGQLSEGRPGLAGALLARAEAHVMRLALLYALMDRSADIQAPHLLAALALWDYAERSVYHVFGDSLGDPLADDLLGLLRGCPGGLTRNELRDYLGRHQSSERIGRALGLLLQHGRARCERQETAGRPAERWFAVGRG
jgi:hypothetical protein